MDTSFFDGQETPDGEPFQVLSERIARITTASPAQRVYPCHQFRIAFSLFLQDE